MSKIYFQGTFGAYSHLAALSIDAKAEIILRKKLIKMNNILGTTVLLSSSNDYFLKDGDCLLFDFGAVVNGYNSDITRTFFVGSASDEQKNFYDAVLKANKLGLSISKPNLTMHNLDDSVLNSLEDSGYKDYIVHKTGHGLGLDVHEDPYIMRKNNELLEEGMVITIEPGLYKQGDLGVRIEDDVLITNDGCKSLTTFSKELRII